MPRAAKRQSKTRVKAAKVAADETPDIPFAEGSQDILSPDMRHRLISEAAYRLYVERGYREGYDLDDWFEAEAQVDHLTLKPGRDEDGGTAAR